MNNIGDFFTLCNAHPWAYIALFINLCVVFVNGYTDGPSTIATAVTSRALRPRTAFILCALFNLLGAVTIGVFSVFINKIFGGDIISTISSLVDFGKANADQMLCVIACGLVAIIVASEFCTRLGLPSSQSNCLIGGLTGSGLALMALGFNGSIGVNPWIKVGVGFVASLIVGFLLGYGLTLLIQLICSKMNKGKTTRFFKKGQIVSASLMNYVHGIQDGGKFIGISILIAAILYASNGSSTILEGVEILNGYQSWYLYLPVCLILFIGCLFGNRRILKNLGHGMAALAPHQAFATDIASSIGLIVATLFGLPLSTGTIKNTAIMGSGAAKSMRRVKWRKAGEIILWNTLAFPISAVAAFILSMIFIWTVK